MSTPAEVAAAALAAAEAAATQAREIADAAAVPPPPPTKTEPDAEIQPGKTRGDLERDAIYARAQANRLRPGDESIQAMAEAVQSLNADQGIPINPEPVEPVQQPAQLTNPQAVEPAEPVQQPSAPPANPAAQPIAKPVEMVTIKVDGRQIAVPAADVIAAGVQTLQKERAADVRLQRVSQAEQQLILDRAALDRRAAEISQASTPRGDAQPAGGGPLPTGGQPKPSPELKQALEALLDSDTDKAAEALQKVIADQVRAAPGSARPAAPAAAQPGTETEIRAPWTNDEIAVANQAIDLAFQDVVSNPQTKAEVTARIVAEMQNPINRIGKVPIMTIAAQACRDVREEFHTLQTPPPPPPAGSTVVDELQARRILAARVPGVPTSGQPRSIPTAPAAAPRKSGTDVVNEMRKARGQPV